MDDGWISSNVPPVDETPEPVYNRGQLHVRRESYWLLAVVVLLRSVHPLLVRLDSLLLSHAPDASSVHRHCSLRASRPVKVGSHAVASGSSSLSFNLIMNFLIV